MVDTQNLVGQGAKMAMDEIYRMLFGNAFVNARQGQPVTAGDIGDTAFTVGLNSLPFGAGGGAVRGAQAIGRSPEVARALAAQALRNPEIVSRQGIDTLQQMARSGDTQFRNVFEVDPSQVTRFAEYEKRGLISPAALGQESTRRITAENQILGIPLDAPGAARPTYGIVTPRLPFIGAQAPGIAGQRNIVQQTRQMLSKNNPMLDEYGAGGANVIFRPKDLSKATVTAGDTGASAFGGAMSAPATLGTNQVGRVAKEAIGDYKGTPFAAPYLEAQMYGANLANARKVTVPTKEAQRQLQNTFREQGINVPVRLNRGAARKTAREKALQKKMEDIYAKYDQETIL